MFFKPTSLSLHGVKVTRNTLDLRFGLRWRDVGVWREGSGWMCGGGVCMCWVEGGGLIRFNYSEIYSEEVASSDEFTSPCVGQLYNRVDRLSYSNQSLR